MQSRRRLVGLGSALPTIALVAHGCKEPTQVTLEVGTNVVCSEMRGVDLVVAAEAHAAEQRAGLSTGGRRFPTATTTACTEGPSPRQIGTLVITPSSGAGAVVVIGAFGRARTDDCQAPNFAPECIVARRRFTFVDHLPITLPVVLDPECAGIPCNESSTCVGKKCVDSAVDCSSGRCSDPGVAPDGGLVEVDGQSPFVDAFAPLEAGRDADATGPLDGGADAAVPGRCSPPSCLGPVAAACAPVGQNAPDAYCCYETPSAVCKELAACANIATCCRDANDCQSSEVCCASTPTRTATTRINCRTLSDCQAGGGKVVCSTGHPACGAAGPCQDPGSPYSTGPDYFGCS